MADEDQRIDVVAQRDNAANFVFANGSVKITRSLVARHVAPQEEDARPPLSPEYTSQLLELAVDLHDRPSRRAQRWHVWMPVIVALTAGLFTLFGIWLKSVLGGS